MEHRTFLDALDTQKDAQDFFAGHGSGGPATGDRIAALRWTSGMDVRTGNASNPKPSCIEKMARLPACLRWEIHAFLPSVLVPGHGWSSAEADM